jgi:CRISPR type III-A-associated protein Csm2
MSIDGTVQEIGRLRQLSQWEPDKLIDAAQEVARELRGFGDTALETQTYKILAAVRKLEILMRSEFQAGPVRFLRPKLAYAVSRKKQLQPFVRVLDAAIGKVANTEDFERLLSFAEAVIAYHRYEEVRQKLDQQQAPQQRRPSQDRPQQRRN